MRAERAADGGHRGAWRARRWAEVFGAELAGMAVGLNDVTVTFTDVRDRRPGLVSVEMSVPPDGEPGDLAVAGVLFRRHLEGQK